MMKIIDVGNWTVFSFSGERPPPCADFSLTSVDLYRAVLYGGHRGTDEDSNDFYLIDFNRKVAFYLMHVHTKSLLLIIGNNKDTTNK